MENSMIEEEYWRKIHSSIQETLNLQSWTEEDLKCNSQEQHIWNNCNLTISISATSMNNPQSIHSPTLWTTPPASFIKFNFDGASKGNPGLVGGGGMFRNDSGKSFIFMFSI